ncbi:hypothetical protein B0H13DRAFT_354628 [Mycena leptocephala]|nr:hypothetical protein B0H13DRAFT_354628 [Mycena leptocephala]
MASRYYCIINLLYLLPSYPPYLSFYSSSSSQNPEPCPPFPVLPWSLVPDPIEARFVGDEALKLRPSANAPDQRNATQDPGGARAQRVGRNARTRVGWGAATSLPRRHLVRALRCLVLLSHRARRPSSERQRPGPDQRKIRTGRVRNARTRVGRGDVAAASAPRQPLFFFLTRWGGARRRRCRVGTSSERCDVLFFFPTARGARRPSAKGPDQTSARSGRGACATHEPGWGAATSLPRQHLVSHCSSFSPVVRAPTARTRPAQCIPHTAQARSGWRWSACGRRDGAGPAADEVLTTLPIFFWVSSHCAARATIAISGFLSPAASVPPTRV